MSIYTSYRNISKFRGKFQPMRRREFARRHLRWHPFPVSSGVAGLRCRAVAVFIYVRHRRAINWSRVRASLKLGFETRTPFVIVSRERRSTLARSGERELSKRQEGERRVIVTRARDNRSLRHRHRASVPSYVVIVVPAVCILTYLRSVVAVCCVYSRPFRNTRLSNPWCYALAENSSQPSDRVWATRTTCCRRVCRGSRLIVVRRVARSKRLVSRRWEEIILRNNDCNFPLRYRILLYPLCLHSWSSNMDVLSDVAFKILLLATISV